MPFQNIFDISNIFEHDRNPDRPARADEATRPSNLRAAPHRLASKRVHRPLGRKGQVCQWILRIQRTRAHHADRGAAVDRQQVFPSGGEGTD